MKQLSKRLVCLPFVVLLSQTALADTNSGPFEFCQGSPAQSYIDSTNCMRKEGSLMPQGFGLTGTMQTYPAEIYPRDRVNRNVPLQNWQTLNPGQNLNHEQNLH
ncbi:hypothetical protein [Chitinibacter sp. S2-10]|uniref:hypothetical protein n=1 Tax=Chitinibacter sp. S2-10 TaxID=3373597 RepID=UPI003977AFF4